MSWLRRFLGLPQPRPRVLMTKHYRALGQATRNVETVTTLGRLVVVKTFQGLMILEPGGSVRDEESWTWEPIGPWPEGWPSP